MFTSSTEFFLNQQFVITKEPSGPYRQFGKSETNTKQKMNIAHQHPLSRDSPVNVWCTFFQSFFSLHPYL
jgi:hypothetical protein